MKACQDGLPCIALAGLWNWSDGSEDKNLIPDFDKVTLRGREISIVPDNDWLSPDHHGEPKNLKKAVYEFAYRLIDRGAKVYIVQLPEGPLKGLDDYLCRHSVEKFKKLLKLEVRKHTLNEMIEGGLQDDLYDILKRMAPLREVEKEIYIGKLSKKFRISKASIKTNLKEIEGKGIGRDEKIEKLLNSESPKQTRFSAMEFIDDQLSYGGIWDGEKVLLKSDGEIIPSNPINLFKFTRSRLTSSVGKRYRSSDVVNGKDLLDRLTCLFSSYVFFRDKRIPLLLAIWVIGTYLFKIFTFYGYLWITSPTKRCGKSKLLDLLSHVCFNATPLTVIPSEASIFREVDENDATQIFDEVESLHERDKEKHIEIFSLLNAGFQKGSMVSRMEKEKEKFITIYFSVYSPKALAGIKKVTDTIEDRSFQISMVRKLKEETIKRFKPQKQKCEIESLREDLYIWALQKAEDVAGVYEEADKFGGIEGFDDRLKDILEPLLCIAHIIDAESGNENLETYNKLVDLALSMSKGRFETEQADSLAPAFVEIITEFLNGEIERFVSSDDLFRRIKENESLEFISSKKWLANILSGYSQHSVSRRQGEKTVRGYIFNQKWVDDVKARYA